jgi:hypothetical protein
VLCGPYSGNLDQITIRGLIVSSHVLVPFVFFRKIIFSLDRTENAKFDMSKNQEAERRRECV